MLFISASEKTRLPEILNRLGGTCTLTVSETDGFLGDGGMIRFLMVDNKVRFAINAAPAQWPPEISAQLLELACGKRRRSRRAVRCA